MVTNLVKEQYRGSAWGGLIKPGVMKLLFSWCLMGLEHTKHLKSISWMEEKSKSACAHGRVPCMRPACRVWNPAAGAKSTEEFAGWEWHGQICDLKNDSCLFWTLVSFPVISRNRTTWDLKILLLLSFWNPWLISPGKRVRSTLTFLIPLPLHLLLPSTAILLLTVLEQLQGNSSSLYQNCFHKVRSKKAVNAW